MSIQSIFVISDDLGALSEICGGAKGLAENVTAVVFGGQDVANEAAACGADRLIYCPLDDAGAPENYAGAIAGEVKKTGGAAVLLNNSIRSRCLAGILGVMLDTCVLTSVNELTEQDGELVCRRMVYGGTAQRCERFTKPYGVVTVSGGAFEPVSLPATTDIAPIEGAPSAGIRRVERNEKKEGGTNLVAAKRIVDVGRGLAAEEDLSMCRALAKAIGAEVGCSRPVAENNKWLPKANYMGITGVQVKPDFIITLGVSGQVQHIGGINKSKVIIAINKDKAAPIFKNCDFGLVGDIYKIVPALIEKLS